MNPYERGLIKAISEAHRMIAYRPSYRAVTGSVTAAILLQQIIYRWENNNFEPFYKYKEPCNADDYRPGDSWCEELGFSREEFDTALKKIAQKVSRNETKHPDKLVWYWTMTDRKTWYEVNFGALRNVVFPLYVGGESHGTESGNPTLDIPYTKITSKTTTESESVDPRKDPAPPPPPATATPILANDACEINPSNIPIIERHSSAKPKRGRAKPERLSPHVAGHQFTKENLIKAGTGENAVAIYYERYSIYDHQLSAPVEDDLIRVITDLPRWRHAVTEWQQSGYKPANIKGQLDWYHQGVPDRSMGRNGQSNTGFGLAAYAEKERKLYEQYYGADEELTPEQEQWYIEQIRAARAKGD